MPWQPRYPVGSSASGGRPPTRAGSFAPHPYGWFALFTLLGLYHTLHKIIKSTCGKSSLWYLHQVQFGTLRQAVDPADGVEEAERHPDGRSEEHTSELQS